ncbi:MAG: hypothetical protein PUC39_07900 [Lachnospiraceae bacterium]|nr:hypothetical protein [Lachnospiraceae bacterium]
MEPISQEGLLIAIVDTLENNNKPILERIERLERELTELRKIAQKNQGMIEELYQAMASGYLSGPSQVV